MRLIKVTEEDKLFSKCVRERVNWTCEKCGKYYPEGQRKGLHCSHFYGRRHKAIRHHPDNAFAHCFSCHQKLGESPVEFVEWATEKLGEEKVEELTRLKDTILKENEYDPKFIRKYLREVLDAMNDERAAGIDKRIEFGYWRDEL